MQGVDEKQNIKLSACIPTCGVKILTHHISLIDIHYNVASSKVYPCLVDGLGYTNTILTT